MSVNQNLAIKRISFKNHIPCVWPPAEPKDLLTSAVNFLSNAAISLHEELQRYTIEDLKKLVMTSYDLEDFLGEFCGKDQEVFIAELVLDYFKKSKESPVIDRPNKELHLKQVLYVTDHPEVDILKNVLSLPLDRMPLYINSAPLEKLIAMWRFSINK